MAIAWNKERSRFARTGMPAVEGATLTGVSMSALTLGSTNPVYLDEDGRATVEWEHLMPDRAYALDYDGDTYIIRRRDGNSVEITRIR